MKRVLVSLAVAALLAAPTATAHRLSGHPRTLHDKLALAQAQLAHDRASGANHWIGADRAYVRQLRARLTATRSLGSGGWLVTAYCLRGRTATGASVGPGVIAVDPTIIPLHSRLWVQGYGSGVALDTGSAIKGYHVDVWMSSCPAAQVSTHYGIVRWWP